jgi:outer membrane lipoprotein carrier protein
MVRVIGLLLVPVAVACGSTSTPGGPATPNGGAGHPRNPADELIRRVQDVYDDVEHLTVRFRQTSFNETFGLPSVNDGMLYFKRPDRMRWDYFSRRDRRRVIRSQISNGTILTAVDKSGRWYYRQALSRSTLPVAIAFLTGPDRLSREFDARMLTGSKHGSANAKVVELTPKKPSAQFKTLVLVVDASSFHVEKSIVTSLTGDTNEFSFSEPDTATDVATTWFVFNPMAAVVRGFREIR